MTNIEKHTQVTLQIGYTGNKEARALLHLQATMPVPESVDLLAAVSPAIQSRATANITEMLIGDDLRRLWAVHAKLFYLSGGNAELSAALSEMRDILKEYRLKDAPWKPSPDNPSATPTA